MNLDLHRTFYADEWARRDALAGAAQLQVGLLVILWGACFGLVRAVEFELTPWQLFYAVPVGFMMLALVGAAAFAIRSMHGGWYEMVPAASKLQEHYYALRSWHEEFGENPEGLEADFASFLCERFSEASSANRLLNTKTAEMLHASRAYAVAALVAGALSLPAFAQMNGVWS